MSIPEDFMPYGPARVVIDLIKRCQKKGLPATLSRQELVRLRVAEGNIGRVIQTFKFLGLINNENHRTSAFIELEKASAEEYPGFLAQILKKSYHRVFEYIDPANDTDVKIGDHFRHYSPASVRDRMMALFMALCKEAQLAGDREGLDTVYKRPVAQKASKSHQKVSKKTGKFVASTNEELPPHSTPTGMGSLVIDKEIAWIHPLLTALPTNGKTWTERQRDSWVNALKAILEVWCPTTEESATKE